MVALPDRGSLLDPKWIVTGVALAAFVLILTYDIRLGLAFGALLGVIGTFWLYIAVRFGSLSGAPASGRHALVARFQSQSSNRRLAVLQTAENAARSSAEQRPDPTERP